MFTFATPIQSFGAYISGVQLIFTSVTFDDGAPQSIPVPMPSDTEGGIAFVGFTDAGQAISSVTIVTIGDVLGVDDVRYVVIPEPSAVVLVAVVLALASRFAAVGVRLRRNSFSS
jgi:hypothetical protein